MHNLTHALFAILFTIPFTFCHADGVSGIDYGTAYLQEKIAYLSDNKITRAWIIKTPTRVASDTDIYLCSYNLKGQLTRQEMTTKRFAENDATLFYNEDGLIESIKHDNPAIGNYIFTRSSSA